MKKVLTFLMVICLSFLLASCGDKEDVSDNSGDEGNSTIDGEYITILTGGSSGVFYPLGGTLAKIYDGMGATANSQSTAASAANVTTINQGKAELGFTDAAAALDGYNGTGSFEDKDPQDNIRSVASLYPNYLQIVVTKASGIETVNDLKDKAVAVGAPGSGTEISAQRILEGFDMSYDDINEDFLSFSEGVEGMKNGNIDAIVISSGVPNSGVLELITTEEITLVGIEEDIILKLQEKYPAFFPTVIPGGTYDGIEEDVSAIAVNNSLITHKDLDEGTVYELTKGLFENIDEVKDAHNAAKDIDINEATENLPAPLHPGAEKYFKEQGINITDEDWD